MIMWTWTSQNAYILSYARFSIVQAASEFILRAFLQILSVSFHMWTYHSFTPLGKRKGNHCSMWFNLQHILVCSWYSFGCHLDQIHPQLKFLFSKQAYIFLKTCFLNIRMLERKAAFGEELGQEHGQLVCGTVERPAALPGVGGKQTGSWSRRHSTWAVLSVLVR